MTLAAFNVLSNQNIRLLSSTIYVVIVGWVVERESEIWEVFFVWDQNVFTAKGLGSIQCGGVDILRAIKALTHAYYLGEDQFWSQTRRRPDLLSNFGLANLVLSVLFSSVIRLYSAVQYRLVYGRRRTVYVTEWESVRQSAVRSALSCRFLSGKDTHQPAVCLPASLMLPVADIARFFMERSKSIHWSRSNTATMHKKCVCVCG